MTLKVKSVNAYIKSNGNKLVVINTEDGNTIFVNEGLIAYACQNAKTMKTKENK